MTKAKEQTDKEFAESFPPNTPHSVIDAIKHSDNPEIADPRDAESEKKSKKEK